MNANTLQTSEGLHLAFDRFGATDDEALLLISGLGAQRIRRTDSLCHALAGRGFQVIRFDHRDAGESSHLHGAPVPDFAALAAGLAAGRAPGVPYTLHDLARDGWQLLDALGLPAAHLVGRSMGGMVAQLMASSQPQRALSLASIMASSGNPALLGASPELMAMLSTPAPPPMQDEAGFVAHRLAFARRIAGRGFAFDEAAQRALILEEARRAHDPAGFARQLAAIAATGDLRPWLGRITAPTLVLHGADDELVPPACGEDTAASISGAEFLCIEGLGHELPAALEPVLVEALLRNARRFG